MNNDIFTANELDKLNEVGNIGAGNAITSLSKLLDKPINMNIARLEVKDTSEFIKLLGDEENYITGMITEVSGDINGFFLLALEIESTCNLIKLMLGKDVTGYEDISELEYSLLCETCNILGGAYLSAFTTLTKLDINQSIPHLAMDMAGAILGFAAIEFIKDENTMLLLRVKFTEADNLLNGTYLLVLDKISLDKIIKSLDALI